MVLVTLALAAPAYADDSVQFTLGRVIHATPDKLNRIGIRSSCADPGGCKADYTLTRAGRSLGGVQALLLPNTVQTDYVNLTKRVAASLRKRRYVVIVTAHVRDAAGNEATWTKQVTLGPKKRR
jgi:hypothetical protein